MSDKIRINFKPKKGHLFPIVLSIGQRIDLRLQMDFEYDFNKSNLKNVSIAFTANIFSLFVLFSFLDSK